MRKASQRGIANTLNLYPKPRQVLNGYFEMDVATAMAELYCWLRYSSIRQLTWQRNYNTQPRILSAAQERLTSSVAQAHGRSSGEGEEGPSGGGAGQRGRRGRRGRAEEGQQSRRALREELEAALPPCITANLFLPFMSPPPSPLRPLPLSPLYRRGSGVGAPDADHRGARR